MLYAKKKKEPEALKGKYKKYYGMNGIEIWYSNGEYLVIDKEGRYGKHYSTIEEAKKDPKYLESL
jgi:hypothetical protein